VCAHTQLNTKRRAIDIDIDTEITEINLTAFRDEVVLFKELVTKIADFVDDLEEVFMWTQPSARECVLWVCTRVHVYA
jgi:hypothetical protein